MVSGFGASGNQGLRSAYIVQNVRPWISRCPQNSTYLHVTARSTRFGSCSTYT